MHIITSSPEGLSSVCVRDSASCHPGLFPLLAAGTCPLKITSSSRKKPIPKRLKSICKHKLQALELIRTMAMHRHFSSGAQKSLIVVKNTIEECRLRGLQLDETWLGEDNRLSCAVCQKLEFASSRLWLIPGNSNPSRLPTGTMQSDYLLG